MSEGFLIFAHDNETIPYTTIALCNALMIRENSRAGVSLVTDDASHSAMQERFGDLYLTAFEHVVICEPEGRSRRRYNDTPHRSSHLSWHNGGRPAAYDLSPYDETILLDADYLVCDRALDHAWGSRSPVMMNRSAVTLLHESPRPEEVWLDPYGPPLYWATCVYFRKDDAKEFFDTVGHVRDNYDYYQHLYRFPGGLYRNDYVFSVAAHILGGVDSLPCPTLLTSFDTDELLDVPAKNELVFLVDDRQVNRVVGTSVHVMNKFSIARCADRILATYADL